MLDEFIDFTQSLFPSISPYVKERTKAAIKQFELNGKKLNLFNYKAYDYLTQGDIFDGIPFTSVSLQVTRQYVPKVLETKAYSVIIV